MQPERIPAAQYVRMSTEHQQYSIENQVATISAYAKRHNFEVLFSYSDEARSGLWLKNRLGLQQLLKDVLLPSCPFKAVLVYDVSRFGRFQDTDEAAHWEFVCKSAGAPIYYCAETFANDNSLLTSIMKSLKRVMAGEYSRELSAKVYEGQKRLSMLGFTMGGYPGYALTRVLLDDSGTRKQFLKRGELKSLQRDRVTLAPGDPREIKTVREIFRMYTEKEMGVVEITKELNRRKIPAPKSGKWPRSAVRRILMNPKYAGCMVYGKRTWKLCTKPKTLAQEEWIVSSGAFEPIVDVETFDKAQQIRRSMTVHRTNDDILGALRRLITEKDSHFRFTDLDSLDDFPNLRTYNERFGSTAKLCELLGLEGNKSLKKVETFHRLRHIKNDLMRQIVETDPEHFSTVALERGKSYLRLRRLGSLRVYACRWSVAKHRRTNQWTINMAPHHRNRYFLLALMDKTNRTAEKLVLVKGFRFRYRMFNVTPNSALLKTGVLVNGASDLYRAIMRLRNNERSKNM